MSFLKRFELGQARSDGSPFEMRSSPRVAVNLAAELHTSMGSLACRLRDVGTGGVCVQTPSPFTMGSLRRITIRLPEAPLTVEAEGCWQRESPLERAILTGVRFTELGADEALRLRKFIEHCVSQLVEFLQASPHLPDLSLDEAIDLALASRLRDTTPGTWVCRPAPPHEPPVAPDSIFLIVRGGILLGVSHERLGQPTVIDQLGPGSLFGGTQLVADFPSPFSAIASHEVSLLELDPSAFHYLDRAKPLVARRLARAITSRHLRYVRILADRVEALERRG